LELEVVRRKEAEGEDGQTSPAAAVRLGAAVAADTVDVGIAEGMVDGGQRTALAFSMSKGSALSKYQGWVQTNGNGIRDSKKKRRLVFLP
jgi:hypothetical protein